MILTKNIDVKICSKNIKHYQNLNYQVNNGQIVNVKVEHLPPFSRKKIKVKCDNCQCEKDIQYSDYVKIVRDNKYYCQKCKFVKIRSTNQKKYGVDNVFQLKEIQEKSKKTNNQKYNVDYPNQNPKIFEKVKNTNLKKYKVKYPTQNKEILSKQHSTNNKRYNTPYSFLNDGVKEKISLSIKEKYGVDNPMKSEIIRKKSADTRIKNLLKKYEGLNIISISDNNYKFNCDCGKEHIFEISSGLLYHRLKYKTKLCTICNDINSYNNSGFQIEISEFIELNCDFDVIKNDRKAIYPNELDFYIPQLKLAFEFNGLYWHSELYKTKNYHLLKTELCEKLDIHLIHIYEDDWIYKKEIVKSRILNLLGKSTKIYARKCEIKEIIDNKIVRNFLVGNHIQGFVGSKIKLGLYQDGNLVSMMTFGSLRKSLGSINEDGVYELLRYCNKLNTSVIGGASKLLNYFVKNYLPKQIISYADRSWSNGKLYEKIGFNLINKTEPNYFYIIDNVRKHRFSYRRNVLKDSSNKSEHEIMLEKHIYRIYDSGHLKYRYNMN